VQFCGNDADTVLAAARHVEDQVDAVDLNFGCPQRIARRGRYGAYLMDDLELVRGVFICGHAWRFLTFLHFCVLQDDDCDAAEFD
jgi:Dihydrouridine synthase (Dus)